MILTQKPTQERMRLFSIKIRSRNRLNLFLSLTCSFWPCIGYTASSDEATAVVKAQSCRNGQTVEIILDQSVKSHSQRDIGWRTFEEEDYYDVERVILVSKSMELHYRWRVDRNGRINSANDRALKLCDTPN
jgi:hypothetical protein